MALKINIPSGDDISSLTLRDIASNGKSSSKSVYRVIADPNEILSVGDILVLDNNLTGAVGIGKDGFNVLPDHWCYEEGQNVIVELCPSATLEINVIF